MVKKRLILPKRFIRINRDITPTRSIRGEHGYFTGRVAVKKSGDKTYMRYVEKDVDVNKDGKVDFYGGTFLGRTTAVKASSKSKKAYQRSIR